MLSLAMFLRYKSELDRAVKRLSTVFTVLKVPLLALMPAYFHPATSASFARFAYKTMSTILNSLMVRLGCLLE